MLYLRVFTHSGKNRIGRGEGGRLRPGEAVGKQESRLYSWRVLGSEFKEGDTGCAAPPPQSWLNLNEPANPQIP